MKKYFKKFLFCIPLLIGLISCDVNAKVLGCISSGDSLKGMVKIGSNYVGQGSPYGWNKDTWLDNNTNFNYCTDYIPYQSGSVNGTYTGTTKVGYKIDYCVNQNYATMLNVYSSIYNSIDIVARNGTAQYIDNNTNASCFTAFVKFTVNYENNASVSSDTSYTKHIANTQDLALYNNSGYYGLVKWVDVIYYNDNDYKKALNDFKNTINQQQIVDQNNTIINQNNTTNNKLDNIDDTLTKNDLPITEGFADDYAGYLPAGPLDIAINMPKTIILQLKDSLSDTCQPIELTIPFLPGNKKLSIPCINTLYSNINGLDYLINFISYCAMGLIVYRYAQFLSSVKDSILTLDFNSISDLENPYRRGQV